MNDAMTKIYLVRHGETIWNTQKRWQGSKNSALTDLGKQQAQKTGELLNNIALDVAYVSPLGRAVQTIDIILQNKALEKQILPAVAEINMGNWEGRLQSEIAISEPLQAANFRQRPDLFAVQGAESFAQLQDRVVGSLLDIFDRHRGRSILIVSHWVAIKVALAHFSNIKLENLSSLEDPKNAELICLSKEEGKVSIIK
jgi:probable phosphoglycerate mutase